jgi:hypothetical protein
MLIAEHIARDRCNLQECTGAVQPSRPQMLPVPRRASLIHIPSQTIQIHFRILSFVPSKTRTRASVRSKIRGQANARARHVLTYTPRASAAPKYPNSPPTRPNPPCNPNNPKPLPHSQLRSLKTSHTHFQPPNRPTFPSAAWQFENSGSARMRANFGNPSPRAFRKPNEVSLHATPAHCQIGSPRVLNRFGGNCLKSVT